MANNSLVGMVLAGIVLLGMAKVLGPRRVKKQTPRRKRRAKKVQVDPLVLKERRLAAELRQVRALLREQEML